MAQRHTLELRPEQERELAEHRDHDPRPHVRERCAAMLKIAEGQAPYAVACQGLLKPRDPDTLYQWLAFYTAEGLAGLVRRQHGGVRRRRLRPGG